MTSSRCVCQPATQALPSRCSHTDQAPVRGRRIRRAVPSFPLPGSPHLNTKSHSPAAAPMTLARRTWLRLSRFLDPPSHTLTVQPRRFPTARRVHQEAPSGAGGVCRRRAPLRRAVAEVEPEEGHIQQVGSAAAPLHTARHSHDPRRKPQGAIFRFCA